MARSRRTYTAEFKAEAVKLVTEQGDSVSEAARSLGINDNLIRNWKQALEAQGGQAFPSRAHSFSGRKWTLNGSAKIRSTHR
jgi:transposase-like protein